MAAALTALAVLALSGEDASAKGKSRRWDRGLPAAAAASLTVNPVLGRSPGAQFFTINQVIGRPSSAQFFTINQVLAQREGDPLRLAAIDSRAADERTSDMPVPQSAAAMPAEEPFGHFAFRAPEGQLWAKWRLLEQDLTDEAELLERCRAEVRRCPSPAARAFLMMIADAKAREGRAMLQLVNRYVNSAIRYESDLARHGTADVWSAPLATLGARRGDCEDYAIAKYVALREAGMAAGDVRLLLVNDLSARQHHAVVAVRHEGRWLILDNRSNDLFEEGELRKFVPLFALDHQGVKLLAAPYVAEQRVARADLGSHDRSPRSDGLPTGSSAWANVPLLM